MGIWVSDFGHWVLSVRFKRLDLGFCSSEILVLGLWFWVSGYAFRVLGFGASGGMKMEEILRWVDMWHVEVADVIVHP